MGTAATTFQTGLERRLPVPVRRARMKGLQAPLQVCSALHSPAGSDRRGFPLPCRARLARQNEYGRQRSRITTSPSLHGGAFLCGSPRPAGAPGGRAGYLARCGALEEDEHAVILLGVAAIAMSGPPSYAVAALRSRQGAGRGRLGRL